MYLLLNQYNFYIGKNLCRLNSYSEYIPYESKTFKNNSDYEYLTDNFFLYTNELDLKKNITVENMQFYYEIDKLQSETVDNEKMCGIIGFGINYIYPKYKDNYFIKILKQKNITSSYAFSFIFYNNYTKNTIFNKNIKYDNFLIIGMNGIEISKIFNTNDLRTITVNYYYYWRITIDEIFFNFINTNITKTLINTKTKVKFDNEFDFIFVQKDDFYFISDYFFKEYIEKNICTFNLDDNYYKYISCEINFKTEINKFPDINFMVRDFNYTFTLTYEDLFIEFNQKIYFMLVKYYDYTDFWIFGKIFLKKFPFIFDYDKKTITFINIKNDGNNEKNSEINYWLFFIVGICIIGGICLGIIAGKIIWDKNRKKHANELVDDYDYNTIENNNEQKLYENNDIINN